MIQITNSDGERRRGRGGDAVSTTSAKNTHHSLSPDIVVLVLLLC
jgi:hypothetical protein